MFCQLAHSCHDPSIFHSSRLRFIHLFDSGWTSIEHVSWKYVAGRNGPVASHNANIREISHQISIDQIEIQSVKSPVAGHEHGDRGMQKTRVCSCYHALRMQTRRVHIVWALRDATYWMDIFAWWLMLKAHPKNLCGLVVVHWHRKILGSVQTNMQNDSRSHCQKKIPTLFASTTQLHHWERMEMLGVEPILQ